MNRLTIVSRIFVGRFAYRRRRALANIPTTGTPSHSVESDSGTSFCVPVTTTLTANSRPSISDGSIGSPEMVYLPTLPPPSAT